MRIKITTREGRSEEGKAEMAGAREAAGRSRGKGTRGIERGKQETVVHINHRRVIWTQNKVSVIGCAIGILRGRKKRNGPPGEETPGRGMPQA